MENVAPIGTIKKGLSQGMNDPFFSVKDKSFLLAARTSPLAPSIELETSGLSLVGNRLFCFTKKNQLLSSLLPAGGFRSFVEVGRFLL